MPRTLTILMPDSRTEYWFTERVYEVGEKLAYMGETWLVTSVGEPDKTTGKHTVVTVRRDDEKRPQDDRASVGRTGAM